MKNKFSLICLLGMMISGTFLGQLHAEEERASRGYMVWGEWQRSLIDFYINKLNKHITLSVEQEVEIRALLNKECDLLSEAQHKYRNDLREMLRSAVNIAHGSHGELKEILTEEQQFMIPGIVQTRKETLAERLVLLSENFWYRAENNLD